MPTEGSSIVEIHQDEVLTGEAVALDVQPLSFFLRALGVLIDMLLGVAVLVLFSFALSWLGGAGLLDAAVAPILTIVVVVTVTVILPTAVETASGGRSLGKLAVGGRIVRSDGGGTGFRHAFIRALVGVFELWFTLGAVAALCGAFTPRSQRLGDLLAGTYSERTRTPRLPDPSFEVPPGLENWAAVADVARLPDRLARRIAQFLVSAPRLDPAARLRSAASLAGEAAPFVSPAPAVDPDTFLRGVAAVRRQRELRAISLETDRAAKLTAPVAAPPRGFPTR
ncbi:putative RDD family membrane protein YckC [Microbacterium terrae]|uniref:RDD family protein n=1 Tax=Microbacterium terrae TaxID=69369 RepID=A0A0M2H5I2_9MICO|nr:RDD family protein [Microbacterium terrae]KJL41750.1 RDD family protein [Microbacterium terrae]MBP1077959.1 putative RDD family membrane protein YckC [Microbacterium terrae]GLK00130.1 RDD family protein [Microbacterium terrae]